MPIKTITLDFENLKHLDHGLLNAMLKEHLKRIALDCLDRPHDKKERLVSLDFRAVPVMGNDRECDHVKISVECKSKVPVFRTTEFQMKPTVGGFLFNQDFPNELQQPSLLDDDEDGDE